MPIEGTTPSKSKFFFIITYLHIYVLVKNASLFLLSESSSVRSNNQRLSRKKVLEEV